MDESAMSSFLLNSFHLVPSTFRSVALCQTSFHRPQLNMYCYVKQTAGGSRNVCQGSMPADAIRTVPHHAEIIKLEGRNYPTYYRGESRKGMELTNLTEETKQYYRLIACPLSSFDPSPGSLFKCPLTATLPIIYF